MPASWFNKALRAACFAGGLISAGILIASMRSAMQYAFPVDSGFGPLRPFVQFPIYLLPSAFIVLVVLVFARVGRLPAMSLAQCAALGAVCGLCSTFQLVTPWVPELPACLVTLGTALGLAAFVRTRIAGGAATVR